MKIIRALNRHFSFTWNAIQTPGSFTKGRINILLSFIIRWQLEIESPHFILL
jgi:hypothetical protein